MYPGQNSQSYYPPPNQQIPPQYQQPQYTQQPQYSPQPNTQYDARQPSNYQTHSHYTTNYQPQQNGMVNTQWQAPPPGYMQQSPPALCNGRKKALLIGINYFGQRVSYIIVLLKRLSLNSYIFIG